MKTKIDVPPNFGTWIRNFRVVQHNMTQNDLIIKAGLGRRTLIEIESGSSKGHFESTIQALAKGLEMPMIELISKIEELWDEQKLLGDDTFNFGSTLEAFTEIDDCIRHLIRSVDGDLRRAHPDIINDSYKEIMFAQISQRFPSFEKPLSDFSTFLSDQKLLKQILKTFPEENLLINVKDDFSRIQFTRNNDSLIVEDPELFWDCSCQSSFEKGSAPCKIHSNEMGELIADLFSKNTKIVYKGLDFFWQDLHALWPPSVDSFYFLNNLMENINSLLGNKKQISSILDVGTGTGFLGIMLTHLFKDVKKLCLTDWTTTSYLYSSINYFINSQQHFQNRDISFQFKTAANTYWDNFGEMNSEDNKYDLVVCNPPYLPIPEKFSELRAENTTAGTELLEHIIEQSIGLGKMTIIQFSHIAKEIAEKVAIKCGRELQLIGKPKVIPFRIPRALENREYMEWLLDENATEKDTGWKLFSNDNIKDGIKRHRYYHQIQTYLIT